MAKRALLIGSATGGLTGIANDVAAMSSWLDGLGFDLDVRQGPSATREGILDGLERLRSDVRAGDAAVLYYTGHGGYSQVPPCQRIAGERVAPRAVQYLVPTDHDKERSFRGIFRAELSLAMQQVAQRTSNITVILDCCHSTDMVRKDDALLKGLIEPWGEGMERHIAWMEAQGHDLERLPLIRSASMVLLSACEVARQAYEITRREDGVRCGLFTESLLTTIAAIPEPGHVTWADLMSRVVDRTLGRRLYQRPQVSGPSSRFLFTERSRRRLGTLVLQRMPRGWCLSGGEAAGVRSGDRYRIVDPLGGGEGQDIAGVEVTKVGASAAHVVLEPRQGAPRVLSGMLALPVTGGPVHSRFRIIGGGSLADELRRRISATAGLEVIDGDHTGEGVFMLEVAGKDVLVRDDDGARLRWPWRDLDSAGFTRDDRLDAFIEDLHRLARGTELVGLARRREGDEVPRRLAHVLDWGVVDEHGAPCSLAHHGAELTVGDRVFIAIENTSLWPLRVSVFDVGVGRAVTLLNPNEPEGLDLGVGETEIIGAGELRSLTGIDLHWPGDTPTDSARGESLVIFVSSQPLPLMSWETSSWWDRSDTRDLTPTPRVSTDQTYCIRHISFSLSPSKDGPSR